MSPCIGYAMQTSNQQEEHFFIMTTADICLTPTESHALSMQRALRQVLLEQSHSHWVTLNFHGTYDQAAAERKLRYWTCDVLSRLFSQPLFNGMPTDDVFRFTALPEFSKRGDPHFHLLLWLDPRRVAYFERIAAATWKKHVPTGSSNIQQLVQTDADYLKVIEYATKKSVLTWYHSNFVMSSMLHLPPTCHARKLNRSAKLRSPANAA